MILVTGGTGLVGSHLLYRLCQDRIPVRAISRNTSRSERVKRLFEFYDPEHGAEKFQQIEWLDGDILDIVSLEDAMKSVKKVYHCAGFVSFAEKHFHQLMKINREGTANVVNACLKEGVEKICHVSSTAALGANSGETVTEELKWKQSPETSGYSLSKYSAEKEIWRGVEEGLNAVIVNPSVVFGSGFWDESSLAIFRTVNNGLHFYTSGSNAFVDGRDLAEIMVRLMESDAKNERFLCTGTNVTFRKMTTMIADQLGKKVPSISAPKWLMGLVWRLSWVSAKLRNQDPVITKASARTAFTNTIYDPSKVLDRLNIHFRTPEDTISNAIKGRLDRTI